MIAVTPEEIKKIEERAVKSGRVSLEELMERAGQALAEEVLKEKPREVLVVSGPGNNGGDGLVAARVLSEKGIRVKVFLASKKKNSPLNLKALEKLKKKKVVFLKSVGELKQALKNHPLVIEALFGFGFRGKAEGVFSEVIEALNQSGAPVYSADVPSGVEAGSGKVNGPACRAKVTVTFSLPKVGLYVFPGSDYAGEVRIKEVVPLEFLSGAQGFEFLTPTEAKKLLPFRFKEANKWSVGALLVIAGSEGMSGAAILTVRAAQRAGAGLVKLASEAKLMTVFASTLTEALFFPLDEKTAFKKQLSVLKSELARYKALAIGPGLKETPRIKKLIKGVLELGKPAVFDATALTLLSQLSPESSKLPLVITPHEGEFSRLSGLPVTKVRENRLEAAENFVKKSHFENLVLVLKGYRTLIVAKKRKAINLTGGPALATAGTGDVLTGIIGALLAQGLEPFDAALLGVYLHGLAADLAIKELGEISLIASDLLPYLPRAILKIQGSESAIIGSE